MREPFRRSVQEHRTAVGELLAKTLNALGNEQVNLDRALGRVLAQDVMAPRALPPWDNSQMDGYAVNTADLGNGALRVVAPIAAGAPATALERGTTAPIMTGAPMPVGANSVIPIEAAIPDRFPMEAELEAGFTVQLPAISSEGAFIRTLGSDIARGSVVLGEGTRLGPTALGLLAGLGIDTLNVVSRPRVLLLSTGDELVAPGVELGPGQIHDANTTLLRASLVSAGCDVSTVGVLDDSPQSFAASLTDALSAPGGEPDVVLSSGGISKGAFDVVKEVLGKNGVDFGSVAMQPGGPQGLGLLALPGVKKVPFIALPGNPVSAYVSFEMFIRPVLAPIVGNSDRVRVTVELGEAMESMPGKLQVRRGTYTNGTFTPLGGSSSHLMAALAGSNALVLINEEHTTLPAGSRVEVMIIGDGS